jgi:hypothetical protein
LQQFSIYSDHFVLRFIFIYPDIAFAITDSFSISFAPPTFTRMATHSSFTQRRMPFQGMPNAPHWKFVPKQQPIQLRKYFHELDALFVEVGITDDQLQKEYACQYVDFEASDLWEVLMSYSPGVPYDKFRNAVYRCYPGSEQEPIPEAIRPILHDDASSESPLSSHRLSPCSSLMTPKIIPTKPLPEEAPLSVLEDQVPSIIDSDSPPSALILTSHLDSVMPSTILPSSCDISFSVISNLSQTSSKPSPAAIIDHASLVQYTPFSNHIRPSLVPRPAQVLVTPSSTFIIRDSEVQVRKLSQVFIYGFIFIPIPLPLPPTPISIVPVVSDLSVEEASHGRSDYDRGPRSRHSSLGDNASALVVRSTSHPRSFTTVPLHPRKSIFSPSRADCCVFHIFTRFIRFSTAFHAFYSSVLVLTAFESRC